MECAFTKCLDVLAMWCSANPTLNWVSWTFTVHRWCRCVRACTYLSLHVAQQRLQQRRLLLVLKRVQRAEIVHHGLVLLLAGGVDVLHRLRPHLRHIWLYWAAEEDDLCYFCNSCSWIVKLGCFCCKCGYLVVVFPLGQSAVSVDGCVVIYGPKQLQWGVLHAPCRSTAASKHPDPFKTGENPANLPSLAIWKTSFRVRISGRRRRRKEWFFICYSCENPCLWTPHTQ